MEIVHHRQKNAEQRWKYDAAEAPNFCHEAKERSASSQDKNFEVYEFYVGSNPNIFQDKELKWCTMSAKKIFSNKSNQVDSFDQFTQGSLVLLKIWQNETRQDYPGKSLKWLTKIYGGRTLQPLLQ